MNAAFEDEVADKEGFEYVVEVGVAQNEAELGGKDKTEAEGRLDHGQVGDSSAHVAVQQVEAAVVVGELASDSEGPQESAHLTLAETVLEPEAVLEVEPATGAVSVSVSEVEAGHRPVGIVEQQTVDRGNTVDTAVGMDLVRGIAGSIVDIVAAVDTIARPLAAQQLDLKLGFEMPSLVADSQHAQRQ